MKLSHCELFHIDAEAQRARLLLSGLSKPDLSLASSLDKWLRPHIPALVATVLARMREIEELEDMLLRDRREVAHSMELFLEGLCRNVGTPEWFEERLKEGLHWARRGVSWAHYFCVMRQLEDSVLDALHEAPGKVSQFARKGFTLELSLASEGFALTQVETFSAAVDDLHERLTVEPLTQASTRAHLMAALEVKLLKLRRDGSRFSLLMLDVDHFKQVNDLFGHPVGDSVLRNVARKLRQGIRASDLVARYGGEEFIIILDDTQLGHAKALAERLREQVGADVYDFDGEPLHVTISVGVTEAKAIDSIESVIARADAALYDAKHRGRNCVVVSEETGPGWDTDDSRMAS